jgi:hypothetical protein
MPKKHFDHLRMVAESTDEDYKLTLWIESGFASFDIVIPLKKEDYLVIERDSERAAFLCAAFHHPFQLAETNLDLGEQRIYLDIILHASKEKVEEFLSKKNQGRANGAISNFLRLTCKRDQDLMRAGNWFAH